MEKKGYSDEDLIFLQGFVRNNDTANGRGFNDTQDWSYSYTFLEEQIPIGIKLYAYLTPAVVTLGLIGNILALVVYVMPQMRQLGICIQLAAVAISDSIVLLIYVLPDWLSKGIPVLGGKAVEVIHMEGLCQSFLFLSYWSRAVSAWLLAAFSVQQCLLLFSGGAMQRTRSRSFAALVIGGTVMVAAIASIYKPILSGFHPGYGVCGSLQDHRRANFILDVTYGLSICVLPCFIITVANGAILARFLGSRNDIINSQTHLHGFTITIIVTTLMYVCLNVPYFVMWIRYNVMAYKESDDLDNSEGHGEGHTVHSHLRSDIYLTRLLFYTISPLRCCCTASQPKGFDSNCCRCAKVKVTLN